MTKRTQEQIVENIVQVMEDFVTPGVSQHGGKVNFVSFENGILLIELSGACSGCAGSTATLKHGIEQLITNLIPEVTAVNGIDDPFSDIDPYYTNIDLYEEEWSTVTNIEESDEFNNREV